MQQVLSIWSNLSIQKRVVAGLAAVAMIVAVFGVVRLATQPGMSLLYADLESGAAGEIVSALEARGATYEIRGNSIFVESTARDELRLTLAGEGLPASASQGYELLDGMSGFGTTSQMFDAAYWRAKEGELARTIVASPRIQSARVHIANPVAKPFQRDAKPTASVTITPTQGSIGTSQARAIRYLVASAVSGLSPDDVSVIDANEGVILAGSEAETPTGDTANRAAALKRNVERLLEARVGYGNAIVEVNVETVTEREQITERRIDPESRIAISQETTESTSNETGTSDDVTVASNLPNGDAGAGGNQSQSNLSETRNRTNYEVSEIQREVLRSPGAIDRITTAVLVDGLFTPGDTGDPVWQPRPPEEMAALRELISAAVGFNEERGDSLSLQSMQFEAIPVEGSEPGSAFGSNLNIDAMRLAQLGILAVITLLIGVFVLRPILTQRADGQRAGLPPPAPEETPGVLTGEIDPDDTPYAADRMRAISAPDDDESPTGSAVERLRNLIDARQDESLQILRSWMEEEEEEKA
ncbi:flagellar basal-body MS-ring/collar protein FliF [Palleronia sp. LCG004]|uniref:flagellar basal-body MS-ring/collar protein FliF n=1 Tax=Palleronia sp. LCG004 TaxID=3079304 RepID=UPI002941E58B|nr:flagellar basal-body MS-ring/collar protein FliF [Palleronia sp. LCG004]WOI56177.1 flagellar basal-body MS-ring/collar protein FliF [Palleronia sp. LCG004]